jgi:8-oxo-dGTP pyrophosphatase MutT (NUDIX family)
VRVDRYRQSIPRPSSARPGAAPTWALSHALPSNITAAEIASVLEPTDTRVPDRPEPAAAVLLPLLVHDGRLHLLFIRRATTLARDPGHVAFPGGRREHGETLVGTALREAEEEIGLPPSQVHVLGALPAATRASGGTDVAPFVGLVRGPFVAVCNPDEVETVFELPVDAFYAEHVAWEEIWEHSGRERAVRFFADAALLGDDLLWGLSAHLCWELLHRLARIEEHRRTAG